LRERKEPTSHFFFLLGRLVSCSQKKSWRHFSTFLP
jgi:hypothetical protein